MKEAALVAKFNSFFPDNHFKMFNKDMVLYTVLNKTVIITIDHWSRSFFFLTGVYFSVLFFYLYFSVSQVFAFLLINPFSVPISKSG